MSRVALLCFCCLFLAGCRNGSGLRVVTIAPPSAKGKVPKLNSTRDAKLAMSWVEDHDGVKSLNFSIFDGSRWSPPQTAKTGTIADEEFASPFILQSGDRNFTAFWSEVKNTQPWTEFAYYARSDDGGKNWSPPASLHSDRAPVEHSFMSGAVLNDGSVRVTWLDGRQTEKVPYPSGHYYLMTASFSPDGQYSGEMEVDDNVCTCCPTSVAASGDTALIGYRERTLDERRDMNVIRIANGKPTGPFNVHYDGWHINACPVNGPAVGASGPKVAVAWFTAFDGKQHIRTAFSRDAGEHFGEPIEVATGGEGHPALALLTDGSAVVAWIELANGKSALKARIVRADRSTTPPIIIASDASFGFPSMRSTADGALLAWSQEGRVQIRKLLIEIFGATTDSRSREM